MGDTAAELKELREQNKLLAKTLAEEKASRGSLEAKLEVLLQQVSAKSEPERLQMLEKQELVKRRTAVKNEALAVAKAMAKGKNEKITHLRYVTGSYYQRRGVNYPPGSTLKIPIAEEPAVDWKAWKPPRITRPVAIDPDAGGVPFGEVQASSSAIAMLRRDESNAMKAAIDRGDVVVSDTTPDQGEEKPTEELAPPQEQGPEAGANPRASDTEVG